MPVKDGGAAPGRPRRGRRPGPSTTRADILAAARRQFAARGLERTSLRRVAADAGVDPKLVGHWFGTKEELFRASVVLPFDPAQVVEQIGHGPRDEVGLRVAGVVGALLSDETARGPALAIIRTVAGDRAAVPVLRGLLVTELLEPVAHALGADEPELRAALAGSQIVGLVFLRHVVEIDPLARETPERLVAILAAVVQHHLTAPLPALVGDDLDATST
ncbi:TetR/AcrR family transcriptional regulator [Cellulomonas composti]|uniref:Putative transcriptional regulator, TetR family protein n=1 Tax=Cellulomonas composti TaxID=266130 RepID=A0A511J6W8_9CELL|nr:TetR family transcriptional regulator [Cellulomonas composti]GEL93728.1 putative transcriptional regulator, TetR family protein [Cellulomonas composti]